MQKTEIPNYFDDTIKKPLDEKEKEEAKEKMLALSKSEREKLEDKILKKHWQNVVRGSIRIYRFT